MKIPELHRKIVRAGHDYTLDALYKARRGNVSLKLAAVLEEVTGIPQEEWLLQKNGNPWEK